jgi:CPA2 family monovalent cation:H+ antiporter-2
MSLAVAVGLALGWELIEALFIGAAAAISSTVVMVRLAGEATLQGTAHGRIAIGVSIVQDLLTIVLVVGLSALGSPSQEGIGDLVRATLVALGFVAAALVLGSRILPRLLALVAQLASRELFVIAVALIAIGMASLAASLGVSIALGAFIAGLALADSDLTASVLGEIVPLRELFATFFFVSIGLLLDPGAVAANLPVVLILLAVITVGKALPIAGLATIAGFRPASGVRAGGLIGQSGEFSFVLASAGLTLGAVRLDVFSVAMGAVVISILVASPFLAGAEWLARRFERRAPRAFLDEPSPTPTAGMRRHAVILGYGRIGRSVARVLEARGFAWVAVDGDYAVVRDARRAGAPLIYGDAGTASVLDEARIADAHALVVAIPDALAARQAIEHTRRRNERCDVVARAHSEAEEADLRRLGVSRVVIAERELGNELIRHALRRFGVGDREITAMLQQRRQS